MNDIIVVEHVLKFIETVLNCGNDLEIPEFYPSRTFEKVEKMMRFFWKIPNFRENDSGRAPALRVTRAETRLTVYRSLPLLSKRRVIPKQ